MFARLVLACALWLMLAPAALAAMPQIWLAPSDDVPRPGEVTNGDSDFQALFAPDATWPQALPQVKVFQVYPYFAGRAPLPELARMIVFLRQHHLKLALEAGPLTRTDVCGLHVEGYQGGNLTDLMRNIKSMGGTVDYLTMDEPLYHGRFYNGPNACHADMAAMAADIARNIKTLRLFMPNIQVGETDVAVGPQGVSNWPAIMGEWIKAYQAATGEKLAYMHLDVDWPRPWVPTVEADIRTVRELGVPVGVIFNATGSDSSDAVWASDVRAHYTTLQADGYIPRDAVFQSWTICPTRALPVSNPQTMTGSVLAYVAQLKKN